MMKFKSKRGENMVGKGENAGYHTVLLKGIPLTHFQTSPGFHESALQVF